MILFYKRSILIKISHKKDYKKLLTGSKFTKLMMENHPTPSDLAKKFSPNKKLLKSFMILMLNSSNLKKDKESNTQPENKNLIFDRL